MAERHHRWRRHGAVRVHDEAVEARCWRWRGVVRWLQWRLQRRLRRRQWQWRWLRICKWVGGGVGARREDLHRLAPACEIRPRHWLRRLLRHLRHRHVATRIRLSIVWPQYESLSLDPAVWHANGEELPVVEGDVEDLPDPRTRRWHHLVAARPRLVPVHHQRTQPVGHGFPGSRGQSVKEGRAGGARGVSWRGRVGCHAQGEATTRVK